MNMKKIIISSLTVLSVGIAHAAYIVKVNLDKDVTFYQWSDDVPVLGPWVNSGAVYDCSNWTPFVETMKIGQSFTQTASDCKQNQTQTAQNREVDSVTGTVRDKGLPYTNTKSIQASDTRLAIGTLETWNAIAPDHTAWANSGTLNSCSNWTPATSTVPLSLIHI